MLYFLLAERLAATVAQGFATGLWEELLYRIFLLLLLIVGFAAFGYIGELQKHPVRAMGLMRREGWRREIALGAALGWGGAVRAGGFPPPPRALRPSPLPVAPLSPGPRPPLFVLAIPLGRL